VRGKTAHRLLLRGDGVVGLLVVLIGDWVLKSMVRLGFARSPPSPPDPLSRQRARGGIARVHAGDLRYFHLVTAQRLVLRGHGVVRLLMVLSWGFGSLSLWCAWVCAVATLTPRPPLPPAGEGEKRARARGRSVIFSPGNRARGITVLLPSPRVGERGRG